MNNSNGDSHNLARRAKRARNLAAMEEASLPQLVRILLAVAGHTDYTEAAQLIVYRRYHPRLLSRAIRWEYLGAKYDADIMVSECLRRFFDNVDSYAADLHAAPGSKAQGAKTQSPDVEGKLHCSLFRILQNLIADFFREKRRKQQIEEFESANSLAAWRVAQNVMPDHISKALINFQATLPPRDAEILRVCSKHHCLVTDQCQLPEQQRNYLLQKYNLSPDHLRVIRKRTVDKLRAAMRAAQQSNQKATR